MAANEIIRKQRFGVEIEMTGISRGKAAEIIATHYGSRVEGPGNNIYEKRRIKDTSGRTWTVMRDASIHPQPNRDEFKVEVVTPPLNYEDIGDLQEVIRKLRKAGGVTNGSCGIHIHIDGANHTPASLLHLVNFTIGRQDLIYDALEIGDRGDRWCRKLNNRILTALKAEQQLSFDDVRAIWYSDANDGYMGSTHPDEHYNPTRYHGINLHAFFTKGTVEFRLFNSTLHAGKIKAYIQFCLAVSAWSITTSFRISFRSSSEYTPEKKIQLMRSVLTHRLGLTGSEFHTCRLHLLNPLRAAAGIPVKGTAA